MLPWLICAALSALALVLLLRLYLLQKSLDDITGQLGERLLSDTNSPILLPTRDPHARRLAGELNVQLRELRRLRQRYENGDRELKEAVTNVSHDLRTPLTAICGYLELLERGDKTADQARYLALISGRAEAMRQLTGELLRYSVAASLEDGPALERVDLNGAVEEAVASLYGALAAGGITPTVSLPEGRVARNLNRAALTITLSNAAPGLDEVQVGRLFDRFYTVETGRHSTGLGLSIARALTERMGGTIAARYEDGRLRVELRFPENA